MGKGVIDRLEITFAKSEIVNKISFQIVAATESHAAIGRIPFARATVAVDIQHVFTSLEATKPLPQHMQATGVFGIFGLEHPYAGRIIENKDAVRRSNSIRLLRLHRK